MIRHKFVRARRLFKEEHKHLVLDRAIVIPAGDAAEAEVLVVHTARNKYKVYDLIGQEKSVHRALRLAEVDDE